MEGGPRPPLYAYPKLLLKNRETPDINYKSPHLGILSPPTLILDVPHMHMTSLGKSLLLCRADAPELCHLQGNHRCQ